MKVHRNCCGLDVHKQTIAACLIHEDGNGNTYKEKRLFGTMTQELRELAQWLRAAKVDAVAMEATGIYWVPVWNVLEREGLHLLLINPEHYRAIRGKKTDFRDGERIAELLQDGRLEGSYVPCAELCVLRDLTRYRVKLVEHQSSVACRIQKLLEQCNIKLGSVASNVLGVSGTAMLHALVRGETDPARVGRFGEEAAAKEDSCTPTGARRLPHATPSLSVARYVGKVNPYRNAACKLGSRNRIADATFPESSACLDEHARCQASWRSSMSACSCVLKECLTVPTLLEKAIYRQP